MVKHKYRGGLLAAPLLALALPLLAACGNGTPASTQVAALGGSASASPSATSSLSPYQQGLEFSACMRSHGITNFPDPTSQGSGGVTLKLDKNSGIDPNSSQFQAAQQACHALQPGGQAGKGGSFDPAKIAPWAACIRKHGVPNFPDPTNTGEGMKIALPAGIDPNTLQPAMQACQSLNPGGMIQMTAGGGAGG